MQLPSAECHTHLHAVPTASVHTHTHIPESDGAAAALSADEASSRMRTRAQLGSAHATSTYSGMAPSAAEQRRDERIEQLASQSSYET